MSCLRLLLRVLSWPWKFDYLIKWAVDIKSKATRLLTEYYNTLIKKTQGWQSIESIGLLFILLNLSVSIGMPHSQYSENPLLQPSWVQAKGKQQLKFAEPLCHNTRCNFNKVENPHNGPSALLVLKSNWFPINNCPCK